MGENKTEILNSLSGIIDNSKLDELNNTLLKEFTLTNVINHLIILNPEKILTQVQDAISRLEYNLNIKLLGIDKTLIRKVHVIDTVKPVITIDGDKEFNIDKYSNFEIPKYTIVDNVDGDITSLAVVSSNLNTKKEGDYEIKITSTDSSNNVSEEKIKVHVEPKYKNAYINISITNQSLEYYERGNLVLSSPIVTGYNNSTPIGNFKVLNKSRNVHLKGADYVSFVNYWIAFKGYSYGLHDASWRNNFGGTIYKTNGSHGCVNMIPGQAQKLYKSIKRDTDVIIKK